MRYFNSDYFIYKENELYCEDVKLNPVADELGTPLYVYSKKFFQDRYLEFTNAFKDVNHKIFFASKSNFNLNVIKTFADLGSGIDVNSAGELYRALKAGIDPKKILLTGVGKTADEIRMGLENDVLIIKAESYGEVELINKIAGELGKVAHVAFRVNPNVDAKTHSYISTGLAENKFGIAATEAVQFFTECDKMPNIKMTGIDMHIGSQITTIEPYIEAVEKLSSLVEELRSNGISIEHFDIGGGMGVLYKDETTFTPAQLAEAIVPLFKKLNCEIMFEPGRYFTANGGVLLTEVLYTKSNNNKNFIVTDAAMTDLLRPSIYGSYHHIQPVIKNGEEDIIADVVGPVCESGDFLAKKREISKVKSGDKLAVMSAGAYSMVMASNYNARRRPAEVMVDGDKYYVVRSRETFEHLLYDEKIVDGLH
ncbi:MAG: diaminopimelate decarboxylase [Melioribacteraceae bacterium]|nr:diaminopimelate decarboxylase [Melioribacteraceae bacterium]